MSGFRFLLISNNNHQVYKIPLPKGPIYKAVPELYNQRVLEVMLHYETKDRKPFKMASMSFNRLQLNEEGQFIITEEVMHESFRNIDLFIFASPETMSEGDEPFPIPKALVIPTQAEKESLKAYIKKYLPRLFESGVFVLEMTIKNRIEINNKNKTMVKDAAKIRNMRKRVLNE